MTYSLGLVPEATRQTATWWKLMPGVIAWLRAAYPSDAFIGSLTAKAESAGPVFIGTTGDGSRMFFIDADRHGSYTIPGVKYTAPGGADARPLTYEMVRAVFAVAPDTDPSTKPMLATSNITIDAPNRPSTKWPLYVGLGLSGLLLAGGIAYMMTRKPAPMAANRARRVRRNPLSQEERDEDAIYHWLRSGSEPRSRGWVMRVGAGARDPSVVSGPGERLIASSHGMRGGKILFRGESWSDVLSDMRVAGYAVPTLAANRARRVKRNSSFGPVRDSAAARARAAFARGDGAAANRALAELRAIDIGLMPRAMKRNVRWENERGRDWRERQSIERRNQWSQLADRESRAVDLYLALIQDKAPARSGRSSTVYPGATPADRAAAVALVAEQYPSVNLREALTDVGLHHIARDVPVASRLSRNPAYAIPERHAYPITTAKDAYHATQRLKQGRVKSEAEAKRIIAAIKHRHPEIWREYLAGYPVSKVIASKRKGLAARHRS